MRQICPVVISQYPLLKRRRRHLTRRLAPVRSSLWNVVAIPLGLTSLLPLSIFADAVLDKITNRVGKRSNTDANGVRCYLSFPADATEKSSLPVVFLLPELYGLQHREVEFCNELARLGYIACAVDTLSNQSSTWLPRVIWFAICNIFLVKEPDYGARIVERVVQWTREQDWCQPETSFGIIGFCYGGAGSIRSVLLLPDEFSASVVFYGKPPSAVKANAINCPVLAVYGTEDNQFSKDEIDKFEAELQTYSTGSILKKFSGQGHAFIKNLASTKIAGAPRDAWNICVEFLNKTLPIS
eukprot:g8506.t1